MKRIEKVAIVLMVLWVLTLVSNPATSIIMARLYGAKEYGQITFTQHTLVTVRAVLCALVQTGVAVWLFVEATRDKAARWVWSLFGLTFGLSAAILYFLVQLVEESRLKRQPEDAG